MQASVRGRQCQCRVPTTSALGKEGSVIVLSSDNPTVSVKPITSSSVTVVGFVADLRRNLWYARSTIMVQVTTNQAIISVRHSFPQSQRCILRDDGSSRLHRPSCA